jgi:hypothetical protein
MAMLQGMPEYGLLLHRTSYSDLTINTDVD